MNIDSITNNLHFITKAFEGFKQRHEERMAALESKAYEQETLNHTVHSMQQTLQGLVSSGETSLVAGPSLEEKYAERVYQEALEQYLRKGIESEVMKESKSLSVGSPSDGGFLVSPEILHNLERAAEMQACMRQVASVKTITSASLEVIDDYEHPECGWIPETGPVHETATPKIGKRSIPVHALYAQPKATQKLIDDATISMNQWLHEKVSGQFACLENTAFTRGDGVSMPRGFMDYKDGTAWGTIETIHDTSLTPESLIVLMHTLKPQFHANACFMMHRSILQRVRGMKDSSIGHHLWAPSLQDGFRDMLLGFPVYLNPDMPAYEDGSITIAFGDFKTGYQIVDRQGFFVLRDPFTEKPFIKFYCTKRVGGDVMHFDAIKRLSITLKKAQ